MFYVLINVLRFNYAKNALSEINKNFYALP